MAALLGSINNLYLTGVTSAPVRAIVGNSFFSDVVPHDINRPYVVLEEAGTEAVANTKGSSSRSKVLDVTVSFNVYGNTRPQVEGILEKLETAFLDVAPQLTVDSREHMSVEFGGRNHTWDGEGWFGSLQLVYRLGKNV